MPATTLAEGGVIELNHAKALAGDSSVFPPDSPGYPIEIRNPGSYRLTSDLLVPPGATGIVVMASDVHLDLGGFSVRGSDPCNLGSCPGGVNSGIVHDLASGGFSVTVVNGGVSNFGASCIRLRDGGRVENVRVTSCGEHGIHLRSLFGDPAIAFGNYVSATGQSGLVFEGGGLYRDNVLLHSGLASLSPTVVGGSATGGNFCDDGRCSRRGTRRFYLTSGTFAANQVLSACAAGFHMASAFELIDPMLEYASVLGSQAADSGTGPPSTVNYYGYARTGGPSSFASTVEPGDPPNCRNWGSVDGNDAGVAVRYWRGPGGSPTPALVTQNHACNILLRVWCIED